MSDYDCTIKDPGGLDSATRMLGRLFITAILLGVGFCAGRASAQVGNLDTYPQCPTISVNRYFDLYYPWTLCVPNKTTHPNGDGLWTEWQLKWLNVSAGDWVPAGRFENYLFYFNNQFTPKPWDRIVVRYRLCTSDSDATCGPWSPQSNELVVVPNMDVDQTTTITNIDLQRAMRDYFPNLLGRRLVNGEWVLP